MPTRAPEIPVTFTEPVAFFCAVSTMAMVSPPTRAATCAALAAADVINKAAEAAKSERNDMVSSLCFRDPGGTDTRTTGGTGRTDARPRKLFSLMVKCRCIQMPHGHGS